MLNAGYSADQQGLLYLRNSITNFKWYQQTVPCQGWDTEPVGADDICTWDGVGCNAALQVTSISFTNNAFLLEGAKHLPVCQHIICHLLKNTVFSTPLHSSPCCQISPVDDMWQQVSLLQLSKHSGTALFASTIVATGLDVRH